MRVSRGAWFVVLAAPCLFGLIRQDAKDGGAKAGVSFSADVMPIIEKHCLPCHAEESFNPSELSLDSYEALMKGGKHGVPVVPGKPEESILVRKLGPAPPFGDPMPLQRRRRNAQNQAPPKRLSEQEVQIIKDWISQGARND